MPSSNANVILFLVEQQADIVSRLFNGGAEFEIINRLNRKAWFWLIPN